MNDPLISVIIPVYNAERTLERCICSLLAQSHRNTELIFVNDGSTDSSAGILLRFARNDKRICVLDITNSGPGIARNKGLEYMNGEYFCFVDSDDYTEQDFLSRMLSHAVLHKADIVQVDHYSVTEKGEIISGRKLLPELLRGSFICLEMFSEQKRIKNFPWGKLFRSSKFREIRFPALYKSEDKVYLFKVLTQCNRMYLSDQKLYFYVLEPNSLSRASFSLKDMDEIKAGLEIRMLCTRFYPGLSAYWDIYIASRSALIYCKLMLTETGNKEKFLQQLSKTFDTHYQNSLHIFLKNRNRALFILLFHWNKRFTAWLYRHINPIKNN